MRILVFSDTHGQSRYFFQAMELHPQAKRILFLGDGEEELTQAMSFYADRQFTAVRGNCDYGSALPAFSVEKIGGRTIYLTHGYAENVKTTLDGLVYRALELKADIALYGHTHCAYSSYEDGLYILNPGSAAVGEYGIIDITHTGIMCINARI